jgi:hypothetical protein
MRLLGSGLADRVTTGIGVIVVVVVFTFAGVPVAAGQADRPSEFEPVHLYMRVEGATREIRARLRFDADRMSILPIQGRADTTIVLTCSDLVSGEYTFATPPGGSVRSYWLTVRTRDGRSFVMRLAAANQEAIVDAVRLRAGIAVAPVDGAAL